MLSHISRVWLFVTLWTEACQAPLSRDSPGKNTGVGCCALLQGIFPTQGSNPCLLWLLHCGQIGEAALYSSSLSISAQRALESITTNKAGGGDGIPVELFQILNDDAGGFLICAGTAVPSPEGAQEMPSK